MNNPNFLFFLSCKIELQNFFSQWKRHTNHIILIYYLMLFSQHARKKKLLTEEKKTLWLSVPWKKNLFFSFKMNDKVSSFTVMVTFILSIIISNFHVNLNTNVFIFMIDFWLQPRHLKPWVIIDCNPNNRNITHLLTAYFF